MEFVMNSIKKIKNLETIKWAFEQGYQLASADIKDGVHIEFSETEKYFLNELSEFYAQKISKVYDEIAVL
jgi:hypothetical protein